MARSGAKFEAGAKDLIKQLAGFRESDENFKLCLQFVQSNFNFHRFLSVDSHKITQNLKGVVDKFKIHSQYTKADSFKKLVDEFLDSHAFENRDKGKTDTHYALLSLLLNLADAPLDKEFEPSVKAKQKEETEKFDWKTYLLEDIEVYNGPWLDDSSDSEWEDDDGKTSRTDEHIGYADNLSLEKVAAEDGRLVIEPLEDAHGESWLSRNLVVQYWRGEVAECQGSHHLAANMTRKWEDHLSQSTRFYVPGQNSQLTEYHLMRETIWLFQGFGSTYVYKWDGTKFITNASIVTSHVTNTTILNLLDTVAQHGTLVRRLQQFVSQVVQNLSCAFAEQPDRENGRSTDDDSLRSQTYAAFADALSKYLQQFREELVNIENEIKKQDSTETLNSLIERLKPWFVEIELIYNVYDEGVVAYKDNTETSRKASGLLATIYNALIECDNKGSQRHLTHLLLSTWLQTCRPYWDIIDTWINLGLLRDQHLEFIIQRNTEVKSLDETFWSTAFTSHMTSSSKPGNRSEDYEIVGWPQFFLPILEHVIIAGKSMEMLQCLGRLSDVVSPGSSRQSLYTRLLDSVQSQLGLEMPCDENTAVERDSQVTERTYGDIYTADVSRQMNIKGMGHPLLRKNFASMALGQQAAVKDKEEKESREAVESAAIYGKPIEQVLSGCVYSCILNRKEEVSKILLKVLQEDYHLNDHLSACRHVLLLEAGDTMYDFYTDIFEKLRSREPWKDVLYLTTLLHEAMGYRFPAYTDKFFVSIEASSEKGGPVKAIDDLNGLTLHYQMSWPVDVVLHSKSMKIYNQVFHFLLQIKRTKYCLDMLRFADLDELVKKAQLEKEEKIMEEHRKEEEERTIYFMHHMRLMRARLLHLVNCLHNYIMTRILHSTALDLQESLKHVTDLDQVIAAHNHFIATIHQRCLLHKQVRLLKDTIIRILNKALKFTLLWQETHNENSYQELEQMKTDLTRCIQFLSSFLNKICKRGSFPHLEALAVELRSSSENFQR